MDQTKELVNTIVEGLQEKKGKNIVTVDLTQLSGAVCQYYGHMRREHSYSGISTF